ncbi:MAG: sulfotransferase [Woeseiaceae bacterium]
MIRTSDSYPFDRPVIILAAPRSGSTLLFETLSCSADFWTIGGESHGVFESIRQFNPLQGMCKSNALTSNDLTAEIASTIYASFLSQIRDHESRRYSHGVDGRLPRLLEKTPKNAVRVSMLKKLFPDALYIYLYRNPRENISSIIDAWRSGRFVTYRNLPGRRGPWSLLLPPGWESHNASVIEEIAAFQWCSANTAILRGLDDLDDGRWTAVSYGQQVHHPEETVERLCSFCDVSPGAILASLSRGGLKPSRYTLTAPTSDKWQRNAAALASVMPRVAETVRYIREVASALPAEEFDTTVDPALTSAGEGPVAQAHDVAGVGRNAPCPCGSGERFKHCHGRLSQPGTVR